MKDKRSLMFEIGMLVEENANARYTKLNGKIERMTKLLLFIALRISVPSGIIPPLVTFGVDFFTDNLTDESFFLPCPVV